jgi:hypothetical protein
MLAAAALAAGLLAPGAAAAGPLSELACLEAALSPAQASALVAAIEEQRQQTAKEREAGGEAMAACGRRFLWTPGEVEAAGHYLPAIVAQRRFRAAVERQGLDVAWLEREVLGDAPLIAAAEEMRRSPPELDAFVARIQPSMTQWMARHGRDRAAVQALGGFIATTALAEGMRRRFARETSSPLVP